MIKNKETAGADERTPSHSEYFSWISHTNEGADEKNTLVNLAYFGWLRRTFGVKLDIYAWDAGNLDGASGTYEWLDTSEKLKKQYPNGYRPIYEAAEKIGTRMGVWCGPDGFGDDETTEQRRRQQMVSLCRDYHFALFKIDGVCGGLRPEKRPAFSEMMRECRKYSPDLVLLNHRLPLGDAEQYATTFLWQGAETYVDIHSFNPCTAPNHRAFIFGRGEVPELQRLTEDHGVCLSSFMDGFEDDIIYQAFNRNLILAPEIYGNPWLLCDNEQAHLAYLFTLHQRLNDILTDGQLLNPDIYGENAVVRGNGSVRILTFGNGAWQDKTVEISLDESVGLAPCDKVTVITHHPYVSVLGEYAYGGRIRVTVQAFRAALYEICDSNYSPDLPRNCSFLTLHETDGRPDKIKVVQNESTDNRVLSPVYLSSTVRENAVLSEAVPRNAEQLYETAMFAVNNDSLESISLKRAGESKIPEVNAAREAFFAQDTYRLRGCESKFAFDGKDDTFFDGISKFAYEGSFRMNGGCLRVDFGEILDADEVAVEFFDPDTSVAECAVQEIPTEISYSTDLADWQNVKAGHIENIRRHTLRIVRNRIHDIFTSDGFIKKVSYPVGKLRYFRMNQPIDRIYKIAAYKNGMELPLDVSLTKANNLQSPYELHPVIGIQKCSVQISHNLWKKGCYLAVGIEGVHGIEGAAVVLDDSHRYIGAADRAPYYSANTWECRVRKVDRYYTYYFPIDESMTDRKIDVILLMLDKEHTDYHADCRLCYDTSEPDGIIVER